MGTSRIERAAERRAEKIEQTMIAHARAQGDPWGTAAALEATRAERDRGEES